MINEQAKRMIIDLLNKATILDLKENYNKNEWERILNKDNKELMIIKEKIQDIFVGNNTSNLDIELMISSAYVDIMIVKERKEDSKTLQSLEIIWSEVHTMTPYKFAMGGKISKKAMLESLEYIKSKGIDVD